MTLYSDTALLSARPPFEFRHSLAFMADFGPLRDSRADLGAVTRAILLEERVIVYRVQHADACAMHPLVWLSS